ncbi:MAG TPA: mercuric transporter MerT family protein, partial [Saprospiraceae bacterium]|nr:mercuric transporter MerT family protein [Saprospiraceae bacterium]
MTPANASIKMGGVGLLTALLASSCCIIPFIAFIAGSSGMASAFSWIAPIRPYLIALSIGVLSFAWYQKLRKNKAAVDCCGNVQQPPF